MYKIAIIKTSMRTMSYISGISHSVALILAAYSHTLGLLTSKLRSSLEAGKEQPRVWIEYDCSVAKMILYPSFDAPLELLLSLYGDSEMVRSGFEEGLKIHVLMNVYRWTMS